MKKSTGTLITNKPTTRFNGRQTSNSNQSMRKNISETNLKSSKGNFISNYFESAKASTSNSRNTRQNKKRQTSDNSNDIKNEKTEPKNAKFEPKNFLDNLKFIKTVEAEREKDKEKIIPNTLEDLPSDNEEERKLGELGREIDQIVSSEHVKLIHANNELCIKFDSFNYENVGSIGGKVFCLKSLENSRDLFNSGDNSLSPLELLLFSSPYSSLRTSILENIHSLGILNKLNVPFDRFMTLLCYTFQAKPSLLKLDNQFDCVIERIYNLMGEEKLVKNSKDIWRILHENINCFLDCFAFFKFIQWKDEQIISLFCVLSRLYLDKKMFDFHHHLSYSIKSIIQQLFSSDENRFNSIFCKFCFQNLTKCADGHMGRTFELFTLFVKFEQFNLYKLSTFKSILLSITSTNNFMTENSMPSLGHVLSILPLAVNKLKAKKLYNDLYFVYTRFVDELTIDKKLLQNEDEESLEMAQKYFREASLFLNKRNINDKMIDLWSRSLHRIREILQNKLNNAKTFDSLPNSTILLEEQKFNSTTNNKLESIWTSSSSDEEDEKN